MVRCQKMRRKLPFEAALNRVHRQTILGVGVAHARLRLIFNVNSPRNRAGLNNSGARYKSYQDGAF